MSDSLRSFVMLLNLSIHFVPHSVFGHCSSILVKTILYKLELELRKVFNKL